MATDTQIEAAAKAIVNELRQRGISVFVGDGDDMIHAARAALAAAEAASVPAGAQSMLNDLANRGLGEVMGKITFSDNATADDVNAYWAERFAGVDAAIRNKAIAALKWPKQTGPAASASEAGTSSSNQ